MQHTIPSDLRATARNAFNDRGNQIAAALDQFTVPDDKVESVVEYCIKLLAGNPHMKNQRIVRKAADKFKLVQKPVEKQEAKVVQMGAK